MAGSGFVILVVLVVLLGIGIGIFGFLQAKKRREELAAYAFSRGWRYEAYQPLLVDRFQGAPFGIGNDRRATNAVYGQHESRDFVSFDYQYETTSGSGKDRRTTTHRSRCWRWAWASRCRRSPSTRRTSSSDSSAG